MIQIEQMDVKKKTALFVMGALHEFGRLGLVSHGPMEMTPKGTGAFDQLLASGFVPTVSDVDSSLKALAQLSRVELNDEQKENIRMLTVLIVSYKVIVSEAEKHNGNGQSEEI